MKNTFYILVIFLTIACNKKTSFSGTVTSSADGKPIEGVRLSLGTGTDCPKGELRILDEDEQLTDSSGHYSLEIRAKRSNGAGLSIKKEGFAHKTGISVDAGKCKEVDFILHPYDAWLKVTFENQSLVHARKLRFANTSEFLENKNYCSTDECGQFMLDSNGGSVTKILLIPGGEDITVIYDTLFNSTNSSFRLKETIFCPRNDTTTLVIKI
jgi:hypothetical protein